MSWHPNRKQWRAIGGSLFVVLLFLAAGWYWECLIVLVIGGVFVWQLDNKGARPEIAVVKSVRCGGCGLIGEPHWKTCPKCGATNWQSSGQ